jgi:hypothetical protein
MVWRKSRAPRSRMPAPLRLGCNSPQAPRPVSHACIHLRQALVWVIRTFVRWKCCGILAGTQRKHHLDIVALDGPSENSVVCQFELKCWFTKSVHASHAIRTRIFLATCAYTSPDPKAHPRWDYACLPSTLATRSADFLPLEGNR